MVKITLQGKVIIPREAQGKALVSNEPLSFWGGYNWKTGEIIDRRHMLSGAVAKDKILAVPFTRGSSTTTAVLLEAISSVGRTVQPKPLLGGGRRDARVGGGEECPELAGQASST